jgi:uncharacterized protein YjbI with pentapeptide repeats
MHPGGCTGIQADGHALCLAHLDGGDLESILVRMKPGSDIDARGVAFSSELWRKIADRLTVPGPGTFAPKFGNACFDGARFEDGVKFGAAEFAGNAEFRKARFAGAASFGGALFSGLAAFVGAQFAAGADFAEAQFEGGAWFDDAEFTGLTEFSFARIAQCAWFRDTRFTGTAVFEEARLPITRFSKAHFANGVWFHHATFAGKAEFDDARFDREVFGPLACTGGISLCGVTVRHPLRLQIAAPEVCLDEARFESTAVFHLRYAAVSRSR